MSKTNKTIITLSTIATIFEKTRKDKIDLLIPFIKYCIADSFNLEEEIKKDIIIEKLEMKFGFENIPTPVLDLIFNRISKRDGCLERREKKFYYKKSVDYEKTKMDLDINSADSSINRICQKISEIIDENNKEKCINTLIDYMNQYGFEHILFKNNPNYVDNRKEINNKKIADYILSVKEQDDQILADFELVYKGLLLMNTIYIEECQYEDIKTNFKKLDIYLDTVMILGLLGIKSGEVQINASNIKDLIPLNVNLKCFKHNFDEVYNIIEKYEIGTLDEFRKLDMFEMDGFTEYDKNIYLSKLQTKFEEAGIIIDYRGFNELYNTDLEKNVLDIDGLCKHLKDKIGGGYSNSETILLNDVNSIQYIAFLRGNTNTQYIENCKAIFVSSNHGLVKHTTSFIKMPQKNYINYAIYDTDLISILWLKNTKYKPNFAKELMLKYSYATKIKISNEFIDGIRIKKEIYEKQGLVDKDILEMIENNYILNRLSDLTDGNYNLVSPEMIEKEVNSHFEYLSKKSIESIEESYKEVINERNHELKRSKKQTDYFVEIKRKNIKRLIKYPLLLLCTLISIVILGLLICALINSLNTDEKNYYILIASVVLIFVEILSYLKLFCLKNKKIYRKIDNFSLKVANKYVLKIEEKLDKIA